jgi:hypothetical protein
MAEMSARDRAILAIQNEVIRLEGQKAELRKKISQLEGEVTATSNVDKRKALQSTLNGYYRQMATIEQQIAAQEKDTRTLQVQQGDLERQKAEGPPQSAEARVKWEKERAERDKNEAAGEGWYTDAEIRALEDRATGKTIALTNAQTAVKNAETAAAAQAESGRHNQAVETYNTRSLELLDQYRNKEIDLQTYQTELNKIYNDSRIELERAQTEIQAAGSIMSAEVTQRGQDLEQEGNIRSNATSSQNSFLSFMQGSMKYLKKGTSLKFSDIQSMWEGWNEAQRRQVTATKGENREAKAEVPEAIRSAANVPDAGLDKVGTSVNQRGTADAQPGTAATGKEAADMMLAKFDEWAAAGQANDPNFVPTMDAFLEHDAATGGEATIEQAATQLAPRFEAPATPAQAPAPAAPAPAPPTAPVPNPEFQPPVAAPPPGALPAWMQNAPQPMGVPRAEQGQQPQGQQAAPGVVINNNMAPAAGGPPAQPAAAPMPPDPTKDPDFMAATDEETADMLEEAGFPPELVSKYRQPSDHYGPFTSQLRGLQPTV